MSKVIIAAILENFSSETDFVIDDTTVVESIDEMNTYIRDNRDETMGVVFEFFFTTDDKINYGSGIEAQMDAMVDATQITYQTALLALCSKSL